MRNDMTPRRRLVAARRRQQLEEQIRRLCEEEFRRLSGELQRQPARDRAVDDQRVLTLREWCKVNNFSVWTGKRLIKAGRGPRLVQINDRRYGVSIRANREWQATRERP